MPDGPPKKAGNFLNEKHAGIAGKWWIVGGALTTGVAYFFYKRSAANGAASTASTADASTTDPSIDPATGEPYADENAGTDYGDYSEDSDSYGDSGGGASGLDESSYQDELLSEIAGEIGSGTGTTSTTGAAKPTDKQWATNAEAALVKNGYTAAAARAAIGAYLLGLPLTTKQEGIVEAAVALEGQPPKSAPKITHATPHKTTRTKKPVAKKAPAKKAPAKKAPAKRPHLASGKR